MSLNVPTGTTVKFDRFWRWLREHTNCILRAGTEEVWLFDHDELHWHLEEDANRNPVVQLIQGKRLLAELVLDTRDVAFVQATSEPASAGEQQATVFELVSASGSEQFVAYHFLLAHPFEETAEPHGGGLKH